MNTEPMQQLQTAVAAVQHSARYWNCSFAQLSGTADDSCPTHGALDSMPQRQCWTELVMGILDAGRAAAG